VHCHYRIVKVFVRWWVDEIEPRDYVDLFKKVKAPKVEDTLLPAVPFEDVSALIKTCQKTWHGQRDKATILAVLDTGARAREFLALDVDNINLRSGAVHIAKGKGNKSRTVFVGKTARRAIRRHLRTRIDGTLWSTTDGLRLNYSGLRGMLRAGTDLETLRCLVGHADLQVSRRYLDLLDDDLQRAHAIASPADQLRNPNRRR
jgi:integrase/recombinase XerD